MAHLDLSDYVGGGLLTFAEGPAPDHHVMPDRGQCTRCSLADTSISPGDYDS
jgi:hypothetical protein